MAEEKHHLFHHQKDNEGKPVDYKKEEKEHKHQDQHGEPGAAAPGTYALHEKHKEKKDPEQAHKQKIKEEVGAAVAVGGTVVAVGAGGYVLHEHHEKKEAKNGDEEANAKKHHNLF